MALSWNDLMLNGSVVDPKVSMWSGQMKMVPSDLGIIENEAMAKAMSLGHHRLIPKNAFFYINEAVSAAKAAIERNSISFGLIRGARYIPEKKLEPLLKQLNVVKTSFYEAVGNFCAAYEDTMQKMIPVLRESLKAAAHTPEAAELALERIIQSYPTSEEVRSKFKLDWSVYAIRAPNTKALVNESGAVKDVLRTMVSELRNEIGDKVGEVLAILAKGGTLKPRSIESALEVLDRVEGLNVFGDELLNTQIWQLRNTLQTFQRGEKVEANVIEGLGTIQKKLSEDIEIAVQEAETNLTAVGRRKLDMGSQEGEANAV